MKWRFYRDTILSTLNGASIRFVSLGAGFLAQVLLVKIMGASEYGALVYASTIIAFAGMFVFGGAEILILREVSRCSDWASGEVRIPRHMMEELFGVVSKRLLVVVIGIMGVLMFSPEDAPWRGALEVLLISIVITVANAFLGSCVQAGGKIALSQWILVGFQPVFFLILIGIWVSFGQGLIAKSAASLQVFSSAMAFLFGIMFAKRQGMHFLIVKKGARDYNVSGVSQEAWLLTLFVALGFLLGRVDVLLLGWLRGMKDVGIYNVAARFADFVGLFLAMGNMFLAPRLSRMMEVHPKEVEVDLKRFSKAMCTMSLVSLLAISIFSSWVFAWYGEDFADAFLPMMVLGVGHLMIAALGPVGYILVMSKKTDVLVRCYGVATPFTVLLGFMLISGWGKDGAAIATATGMVVLNTLMLAWIIRNLKFNPSIFGFAR